MHLRLPCAKFPAEAVQTPDFRNLSLSSIHDKELTAGRTLKDPIGCKFSNLRYISGACKIKSWTLLLSNV